MQRRGISLKDSDIYHTGILKKMSSYCRNNIKISWHNKVNICVWIAKLKMPKPAAKPQQYIIKLYRGPHPVHT